MREGREGRRREKGGEAEVEWARCFNRKTVTCQAAEGALKKSPVWKRNEKGDFPTRAPCSVRPRRI